MSQAEVGLPLDVRQFCAVCTVDILLIRYLTLQIVENKPRCAMVSIAIASPPAHLKKTAPATVQWRSDMKHIPNILTGLRILCSALLLATPVYSSRFYLFYLVCGVTDFLDGRLARRLHAASKAGASLDNIADYTLLTSTAIRVLPTLEIETWSLIWGICMLIAHVTSSIIAWVKYKRVVVLHTLANKLLGGAVYAIPLLAGFGNQTILISTVSAFMCFSVPEEIYLLLTSKQLEPDVRGIFFNNSNIHRGYSEIADVPSSITSE